MKKNRVVFLDIIIIGCYFIKIKNKGKVSAQPYPKKHYITMGDNKMFYINNIILFLKIVNSILLILFQIINQNKYQKLYSMLKNINLILTLIINILSIINFDLLH